MFDILKANAAELQAHLRNGSLSSVQIIESCLSWLHRHNRAGLELNAMISVAPEELLLLRAQGLDRERAAGHVRSPLHGLPIIVKVRVSAYMQLVCNLKFLGCCHDRSVVGHEYYSRLVCVCRRQA